MSLEPYYFRPLTPPQSDAGQHSRNVSSGSYDIYSGSPESVKEPMISRTPMYRQCGPTLLPKIRSQDNNSHNNVSAARNTNQYHHQRAYSSVSNVSHFSRPSTQRSSTDPIETCGSMMSPVSMPGSRSSSVPVMVPVSGKAHSRSSSTLDESMLNRYGYPTYRQMPVFQQGLTQQSTPSPDIFTDSYLQYNSIGLMDPPSISIENFDLGFDLDQYAKSETYSRPNSTSPPPSIQYPLATSSLLGYLSQPTQPVNLVQQLTFQTGRGLSSHFWWDVRNIRPWTSFNLIGMAQIPDMSTLLNFQHDLSSLPALSNQPTTVTPASEIDLANIINKIYFPKVNVAAQLSLGQNCPSLYLAPPPSNPTNSIHQNSHPHFLANYPTDSTSRTLTGLPRGRVVGLVKSFDRWNTGMRHEGPGQRVAYLKGLAHLQKCMRDHSCRYGFIITEIELVCVRAGCDNTGASGDVPWFGYLEVSEAIAVKTATAATSSTSEFNMTSSSMASTPFTVSLALYYLLMLAKATPLPTQPSSFMDVGGPGALTRQKVWHGRDLPDYERGKDGKDKWMPEPQVGEKRDAKTARGWVWPSDPWHKREGGGSGRKGRR